MKFLFVTLALAMSPAALAQTPPVAFAPEVESQAREVGKSLRCVVCQNQSIDDSDADLARDLRLIVRERLVAGDTDAEVTQYIVDRYGEFVLLNPVVAPHTLLLWVATPVVLLIGLAVVLFGALRARRPTAAASADEESLSKAEEAALRELEKPAKGR